VSARRVSLAAWGLGGALSATSAVLLGAVSGTSFNLGVGPGLLMRALAGAMAARLVSLPKAALWGVGIGLFEQILLFNIGGRTGVVDAILLGFILVVLLTQRRARGRAGDLEESSWPVAAALRTLPRALAEGDLNRRLRGAVPAALLAAAVAAPWTVSGARTLLLVKVIAFAIAGLSLVILTGYGGQISLGQWAIAGVGAFAAARLDVSAGWPAWSIPVAAVFAGAATATVVGLPALRLRGLFLAVTTLAFAVAASSYLFGEPWFTGGQQGVTPSRPTFVAGDRAFYLAALVALVVAMLAARQASRGRLGRCIAAVRENERAAAAMGINVVATKLTTFALSGAVAGLAGWVFVYGGGIGNVESFLAPTSLLVVALAVVGGIGSVAGPVVGAALVVGLPGFFPGQAFLAAFGTAVGVLQVLLHVPAGLVSLPLKLRDAIVRGGDAAEPTVEEAA
jgi:ABC-type branched-subunit amino acid transport system permease subunit